MKQIGFFTEENRLSKLSSMGDPLERASSAVDFEMFRSILDKVFRKETLAASGRPPWDYIMMFKILLLQQWYNIADDTAEYMINDRLSFQRFLGLSLGDKVPDAKTIWLFRENLTNSGLYEKLFTMFRQKMESMGVITRSGSIIDASFVDAPKQRNTREENQKIKDGAGGDLWEDNVHKCRQKDKDARWAKKNDETHYGYKDHVKVDRDSKMIVAYSVTNAAVHDSQEAVGLIDEKDNEAYLDCAYASKELQGAMLQKNPKLKLKIVERKYRNKPLTEEQKLNNREKSSVRVRVEHVFGHMTNSFGAMAVRSIGITRARYQIAFRNLAYNLQRYECLVRLQRVAVPSCG